MLFSRGRYLSSEPSTKAGGSRVGGVVKDHDDDDGKDNEENRTRTRMAASAQRARPGGC